MSHLPVDRQDLMQGLARISDTAGALAGLAGQLPAGALNLRRLVDELLHSTSAIRVEVEEALLALEILESGQPLASTFPDGSPAPLVPSPRQVMYLANLAGPPT